MTWHVTCGQVWLPNSGICALHLPILSAHIQQWTHTQPEHWATIYAAAPGKQLGVRCLAQGHMVSRAERVVYIHSPHLQPLPDLRLELATFGLRVRLSKRLGHDCPRIHPASHDLTYVFMDLWLAWLIKENDSTWTRERVTWDLTWLYLHDSAGLDFITTLIIIINHCDIIWLKKHKPLNQLQKWSEYVQFMILHEHRNTACQIQGARESP